MGDANRHFTCIIATLVGLASCTGRDSTGPAAAPGPASQLLVEGGNGQSAFGGQPLAQAVRFKVADRNGTGVAGATVVFDVVAGEGTLTGTSPMTSDAAGIVIAPTWTVGRIAIPQQLRATTGILQTTAAATIRTQYHAEVRFFGSVVDTAVAAAFIRAAARINAEVVGALVATRLVNADLTPCGITGVAPLSETINSLVIYVSVVPPHGLEGLVARSGPCYVRQATGLTVVGAILIDAAALPIIEAQGHLGDVIFHEMHHVLGFGTLWSSVSPPLNINAGTSSTAYVGVRGVQGCVSVGGAANCASNIPLENIGGPGTVDVHWRRSEFETELMVGFVAPAGVWMPLSAMTIGALTDLGYVTNASVTEPYTVPSSAVAALFDAIRAAQNVPEPAFAENVLAPRFSVAPNGDIRPIRR